MSEGACNAYDEQNLFGRPFAFFAFVEAT